MSPPDTLVATRFPAMGGIASVTLDGPAELLGYARCRLADLEQKWSRFRPESEISRLNERRNDPIPVSQDTRLLVRCSATAWTETGGAFDPSVLDSLVAWGYSADFTALDRPVEPVPSPTAVGLSEVRVDDSAGTVDLGGAGFDPGGIGKGLAADLVATELVSEGADAALVDVAGDLRVVAPPDDDRWVVGLEDPCDPSADLVLMRLAGGAIATSSTRRRRWTTAQGRTVHHLHDPRSGSHASTALRGVSVLAGEGWWAEALTKYILVGGVPASDVGLLGASAIGRTHDGAVVGTDDLLDLRSEAA